MTSNTIMVFCAHSDDQIFGPGATLAKYAKQGKKIVTIIFSYGELSMPHIKKEVAIKTRVDEAKAADDIIKGYKVMFLGLSEKNFSKQIIEKDTHKKITNLIQKYRPSKIFTHSFDDFHPNHRKVYHTVIESLDKTNYKAELYTFDVWNPFNIRKRHYPKMYVDVSDVFKIKLRAIGCFESQLNLAAFFNYWPLFIMYAKAFLYGIHIDVKYAERFFKLR